MDVFEDHVSVFGKLDVFHVCACSGYVEDSIALGVGLLVGNEQLLRQGSGLGEHTKSGIEWAGQKDIEDG